MIQHVVNFGFNFIVCCVKGIDNRSICSSSGRRVSCWVLVHSCAEQLCEQQHVMQPRPQAPPWGEDPGSKAACHEVATCAPYFPQSALYTSQGIPYLEHSELVLHVDLNWLQIISESISVSEGRELVSAHGQCLRPRPLLCFKNVLKILSKYNGCGVWRQSNFW